MTMHTSAMHTDTLPSARWRRRECVCVCSRMHTDALPSTRWKMDCAYVCAYNNASVAIYSDMAIVQYVCGLILFSQFDLA